MTTIAPAAEPRTIDQVLARLNGILDDALRQGTRIGYFAALYERVTTNVRRALVAGQRVPGQRADGAAGRGLRQPLSGRVGCAHVGRPGHRAAGRPRSRCWTIRVRSSSSTCCVGMNAHINLDLGIAAATVAHTPGGAAGAVAGLQDHQRRAVAPGEGGGGRAGADLAAAAAHRGHCPGAGGPRVRLRHRRGARLRLGAGDGSWRTRPWPAGRCPSPSAIAVVAEAGRALYPLHGIAGHVQWWIHAAESADVRYNIQVVAE